MISLTNYDFQWARSELLIIYPGIYIYIEGTTVYMGQVLQDPYRKSRGWTIRDTTPGMIEKTKHLEHAEISNIIPDAPCMVYLPTKLCDFVRANVGTVNIPAPG